MFGLDWWQWLLVGFGLGYLFMWALNRLAGARVD